MSERDGWNHLYLIDGATGAVKNQITKGAWPVRHVDQGGRREAADLVQRRRHECRQGSVLPALLPHQLRRHRPHAADHGRRESHRRVLVGHDSSMSITIRASILPSVLELDVRSAMAQPRHASSKAATSPRSSKPGWKAPEVFVAKGRDGTTDIWGLVWKPTRLRSGEEVSGDRIHLRRAARLAHAEDVHAPSSGMQAQAELGFIVVQIDGMGTSNRSKAFHDVAGRTSRTPASPIASSGTRRSPRSIRGTTSRRVGIYGGSAGGQNSMGALLFHPEFYKVAVSYAGCHDNRMDKIWWNEQWMGWPIGPQYAASSNVDNAHRLQGKLLLIVGELDTNVDPASTLQVVERADQGEQEFRFADLSRAKITMPAAAASTPIRRAQALRLLRAAPAGSDAAGVERPVDDDDSARSQQ